MAWLSGYSRRKKITVDHTYVDSDLTDFPLLVKITSDSNIGSNADSNGYNIRFTSSDGTTLLKYERQAWSGGGGSAATAIFWVKIPNLQGAANTEIYVYYKSDSPSDGADPTNVWDSNFRGVWHLNQGGTTTQEDSTSNNRDFTPTNMESGDSVDGPIGKWLDFDGSNEYLTGGAWTEYALSTFTVELLFRPDSTTAAVKTLLAFVDSSGRGFAINADQDTSGGANAQRITAWFYTGAPWQSIGNSSAVITGGTTYYLCYRRTSGSSVDFYVNETLQNSGSGGSWAGSSISGFDIGRSNNTPTGNYTDGKIGEVRISTVHRSDAWRKFTYRNIIESDNEISFSAEESIAGNPTFKRNGGILYLPSYEQSVPYANKRVW